MFGGEGADRFIFTAGSDVIRDFDEDDDRIDLSAFDLSYAQVLNRTVQQGDDLLIRIGAQTLRIEDMRRGALDSDDFIL
ncbi:hypothetical protein DWF04_010305 [Cereibacter sphaeroides f. sp. denitrificans]